MADAITGLKQSSRASLSRRAFLRLAGASAVAVALGACATTPAPTAQSGKKVELVFQDAQTDWYQPVVQSLLEEFHTRQPNIRVFYSPEPDNPKDKEEKTLAAMQAGTAPDVFQGCCSWFPIWAQKGYTLDLHPYVKADIDPNTIDDWDAAQYNFFFTQDGRQYALPKYHGALALYYNKNLFDLYRVPYPDASWDHDDYTQAMKYLTNDQNHDGKTDLWGSYFDLSWDRVQVHINGWNGHLVDPQDPSKCRMGDAEALAAIGWLRARMWEDKVMATALDVQRMFARDAFLAGRVAMAEEGSWGLKDILSGADFRVGVAPFPAGPVRRVTLASADGFGIYADTRHPEAAWELVKFLVSKESGRAMAKAGFLQPARASLVDEWVGFIRAEFPEKAKEMDIAAFAEGHVKGYSVTQEVATNMAEATRLALAAWDQVLTLGQLPVDYLKTVAGQIDEAQRTGASAAPCCNLAAGA